MKLIHQRLGVREHQNPAILNAVIPEKVRHDLGHDDSLAEAGG